MTFSCNFEAVQRKSKGWGHNLLSTYYRAFKEYEDLKISDSDKT
jgi:hypothetical protein